MLKLKRRNGIRSDAPIPRQEITDAIFESLLERYAEAYPRWPWLPFNTDTMMIHL